MKTIGLIGGMSWESSQVYYQIINQIVRQNLGDYFRQKLFCTALISFYPSELGNSKWKCMYSGKQKYWYFNLTYPLP